MRSKNSFVDTVSFFLYEIFVLILNFFLPRLIIGTYGSEINGLTANINQVINFLNLLQAGISGASIFEMYLPIATNDYRTVGAIYYSSCKYFKKMSYLFFALCCLIIPYLQFFGNSDIGLSDIIISVFFLGLNSTLVFRYVCSFGIIFCAHQQRYVIVVSNFIERLIFFSLTYLVVYVKLHFTFLFIANLVGTVVRIVYLNYKFENSFRTKIIEYKSLTTYKVKNQYKLLGNNIVEQFSNFLPVIIVTLKAGLNGASIISVYLLVVNFFKQVFSSLMQGVISPFGELVAIRDKKKLEQFFAYFQTIILVFSFIGLGTAILMLIPFIKLYLSGTSLQNAVHYFLSLSTILYCIGYSQNITYNILIEDMGLYGKILNSNIIIGVIASISTCIFGYLNFEFIYFGPALFYFLCAINKFYVLAKNGINFNIRTMIRTLAPIFYVTILFCFSKRTENIFDTWQGFFKYGIIFVLFNTVITILFCIIFDRKNFLSLCSYAKSFLKKGNV